MKVLNRSLSALLMLSACALPAFGQAFSAGSNGSFGPLDVTTDQTLDVPADGVFHCTTINVAPGRVLRFRRNALNTPVYLLATGNVTIQGTIDVRGNGGNNVSGGEAGPGGFDGGNPASVSAPAGSGYGPGGGRGGPSGTAIDSVGAASYATAATGITTNKGATYGGALLIPMVGGSGGGGSTGPSALGGGGGGGAVLIASNTRIDLSGTINAEAGGNFSGVLNGGSGGAIRLLAPVIAGNGNLRVNGNSNGGSGRIRIDTLNRTAANFVFSPPGVTSIGSLMIVFPTPNPRLDIIEAAGTAIPPGSSPVFVQLPFGSSPSRTVKVQARDFNDVVPITLQLTPDNGTPVTYQAQIDNKTANPAQSEINVTLPVNVQVAVHVWTR